MAPSREKRARDAYHTLLRGIYGHGKDFLDIVALAPYFPHLSVHQLTSLVPAVGDPVSCDIPAPAVCVLHTYHIIRVARRYDEHWNLCLVSTTRAPDAPRKCDRQEGYARKAMEYAQTAWGTCLVRDTWASVIWYHLYKPCNFPPHSVLTTQVIAALGKDFHDIPQSEWDGEIRRVAWDHVLQQEIEGDHPAREEIVCGSCGGGVRRSKCKRCGTRFDVVCGVESEALSAVVKKELAREGYIWACSTSGKLRKRRYADIPSREMRRRK